MQETLFANLKNTVNVLVVDDVPAIISVIEENLTPFKIYSVHTAESATEALDILKNGKTRFHVCLSDLGLYDMERNEFYLLDKYGKSLPFVIMSAQDDTEKSLEAKKHGAMAYVRKGNKDFVQKILANLNQQALRSIVCPKNFDNLNSPLCRYIEALINKKPDYINDWAREADITDRQLRYEWEEKVGFSPKHSLCLFHLFSKLFEQIEIYYKSGMDLDHFYLKQGLHSIEESTSCKRFMEYFLLNQNDVLASIRKPFQVAN